MSTTPASEPTTTPAKRRIGDILLAHEFVTEAQLADATAEQERTGQPLGQILVQHGSITRLELASALAEQWSDPSAAITLLPRSTPATPAAPAPTPQDEAQYAARLQDAVAALARRVQSDEPLEGFDQKVADLSRRIESTLARTQHIEAALATLADSLEGVTGGVEEAFVALQAGTAELATDLTRIDTAVGDLSLQVAEIQKPDPHVLEEIEELRSAVASLDSRTAAVGAVSDRLEEIASRLDTVVEADAVEGIRAALHELESRLSDLSRLDGRVDQIEALAADTGLQRELDSQASVLEELRGMLAELEQRPTGTAELDVRLHELEARLESALAETAAVDELAARLASEADRHDALVASVEGLDARIAALPVEDGRVNGVLERLEGVEARLEDELALVEDLRSTVAAAPDPISADRLEELAAGLAEVRDGLALLATTPSPDPALASQVTALADQLARLSAEVGDHSALATLTGRLESLDVRVAELPVGEGLMNGALERLNALEARLEDWLASIDAAPGVDPALATQVRELTEQVGRLAADRYEHAAVAALAARVETLETRPMDGLVTGETLAQALDVLRAELSVTDGRKVEELEERVDAMRLQIAGMPPTSAANPALVEQVARLALRVDDLGRGDEHEALVSKLEALEAARSIDLDTLGVLARAMDRIRQDLVSAAPPPTGEAPAAAEDVAALAERLHALESVGAAAVTASPSELAGDLERARSTIEMLERHLTEHDRVLAELKPLRGLAAQIEGLAARLDALSSAGTHPPAEANGASAVQPSGDVHAIVRRVEEAETASRADREKLMNRLERLAASMDWRLQRLEAGDEAE